MGLGLRDEEMRAMALRIPRHVNVCYIQKVTFLFVRFSVIVCEHEIEVWIETLARGCYRLTRCRDLLFLLSISREFTFFCREFWVCHSCFLYLGFEIPSVLR